MRKLLLLFCALLPQSLKQAVYRRVFGWRIGRGVRIGFSFIEGQDVQIGDRVRIGHLNVFRRMKRLHIGTATVIRNQNEIAGASDPDPRFPSEVFIGEAVAFMSRHYIDGSGSLRIGNKVVVAGRDTHFWGHTLIPVGDDYVMEPLSTWVGEGAYIGARSTLLGCHIPARAIVGAGSVVRKQFEPEPCRVLIAGNPATIRRRYTDDVPVEALSSISDEGISHEAGVAGR